MPCCAAIQLSVSCSMIKNTRIPWHAKSYTFHRYVKLFQLFHLSLNLMLSIKKCGLFITELSWRCRRTWHWINQKPGLIQLYQREHKSSMKANYIQIFANSYNFWVQMHKVSMCVSNARVCTHSCVSVILLALLITDSYRSRMKNDVWSIDPLWSVLKHM